MANFEKFTRGDYGLFAHCERKKDENGNYITLGNQRIDPARTHLNYNMCPNSGEQRERLEARLSDPNVKCLNRADVNVYGGWCVTLPTHVPVFDDLGNIVYEQKTTKHKDGTITEDTVPKLREVQYTGEETKRFFELVYLFLTERYGEENVISAYVHMDETTPHMHFLFVPVIEDKKWNAKNPDKPPRVKVCAKELIDKIEMSVFHPELQKFLDTHSEKNLYPVLNGTTIGGNRTIAELKAQTALEEAVDATRQAQAVKEEAERTISEVKEQEKQSYEPENLWISSSGNPGMDDQPYSLVKNDKIIMNLLILAYEKPVTVPELADAIGISTTYIEPIVDRLVDGELMKQSGDKVFTDFIIYTEQDRLNTFEIQKELATRNCNEIWKYMEDGLNVLRNQAYCKRQNVSQAAKLEGFFVLRTVYNSVLKVRDEIAGHTSFESYPYRKDGGRWFAMGNRVPTDYNYGTCPYSLYEISGEAVSGFNKWSGAKWVALFDYDTDEKVLGKSHSAYRCAGNFGEAREGVTKLLYAIYREDESFLSGISQKVLESIDDFLKLDFLERTEDGKLQLNVPVLNMAEKKAFYELMEEYSTKLSEIFHDDYAKMIQNPVAVPKQIRQDVPGFLRYLNTCCYFPSAFIYELRKKGLFLKGYEKPAPAVFMEIEMNGE